MKQDRWTNIVKRSTFQHPSCTLCAFDSYFSIMLHLSFTINMSVWPSIYTEQIVLNVHSHRIPNYCFSRIVTFEKEYKNEFKQLGPGQFADVNVKAKSLVLNWEEMQPGHHRGRRVCGTEPVFGDRKGSPEGHVAHLAQDMNEFCHWKYRCHSRNYSMGETQPVKLRQIVCLRAHNTYLWNDLNLKWKRAVSWHTEMMLNSDAQVISHKIFGFLYTYCSTQFLLITGIHNKWSSVIHWSLISSLTINGDKNGLLISHIHHGRGGRYTSW